MNVRPHLEVIYGTMFADKSTSLVKRLLALQNLGIRTQAFKPEIDGRYGPNQITSHNGLSFPATDIKDTSDLLRYIGESTKVVGIYEVQFLNGSIIDLCDKFANEGRIVIVAGLDRDFRGEYFPFGKSGLTMADLIVKADIQTHRTARCLFETPNGFCGGVASRVQRFIDGEVAPYDSPTIAVGKEESYTPRCRQHFQFYEL